jgi:hypothetical protein
VEDDGRIVSSQNVTLPPDGQSTTVRVNFTANDAGPRLFKVRIEPQSGEQVTQNNSRDTLVEVWDRRERVLYMEGEPRFEMKFIRRAIGDDPNLAVTILQRTAEDKYLRLDVTNAEEVVGGFPKTREELFGYRAIILGSVEAASFTPDQLRMLADFVSKRGGGLLMLGGRRSFAEGGWAGTPVAEVLPVELADSPRGQKQGEEYVASVSTHPTRAGLTYPVTQLGDTEQASSAKWDVMPSVTTVNPIHAVKPGATVLLTVEDTTHATFWRKLVRWLVDGVPDPVEVTTSTDRVEPGESVKLTGEIVDPTFTEVNDAHVVAEVKSPSGKTTEVPLEWTVSKDGEYKGAFVADEPGIYQVKATAQRNGADLGSGVMHTRASAGDSEYFDAAMRSSLLNRLAEETGGRFFTPSTAGSLPEAISYSGRGVTVVEERDLWDMPIILMLILALIGADWGLRRVRGLA